MEELKAVTDALAIEKKKNQDLRAEIQTITREVKLSNSHEDKNVAKGALSKSRSVCIKLGLVSKSIRRRIRILSKFFRKIDLFCG